MKTWGRWCSRWMLALLVAAAVVGHSGMALAVTDAAAILRDKQAELALQLRANPLGRPLVLTSTQQADQLRSEIHAVLPYSLAQIKSALEKPENWCDMLMLNIKTIGCVLVTQAAGTKLRLHIGRTGAEDLANSIPIDFAYQVHVAGEHYLDMGLEAKSGPSGTRDYQFRIEAIDLPDGHSVVHLTYAYAFNAMARFAMQTYLATLGQNKVGFTREAEAVAGRDGFIGGLRGLVERNAMRYFLAIDAYLQAQGAGTPAALRERRLQHWFDGAERFARQLHEVDRATYLAMKQAQLRRQQELPD